MASGESSISVAAVQPFSSAIAYKKGFNVEPGCRGVITASMRLPSWSAYPPALTHARTSLARWSTTSTAPSDTSRRCSVRTRLSSIACTRRCNEASIVVLIRPLTARSCGWVVFKYCTKCAASTASLGWDTASGVDFSCAASGRVKIFFLTIKSARRATGSSSAFGLLNGSSRLGARTITASDNSSLLFNVDRERLK